MKILLVDDHILFAKSLSIALCDNPEIEQFSSTKDIQNLEKQIDQKGMNYTLFKACRQFYKVYPQIGSTVSSEFKLPDFGKSSTVSNEFVTDPDVLVKIELQDYEAR